VVQEPGISTSAQLNMQEIFDLIRTDLGEVERAYGADTVCSVDAVTAMGQYLQLGGGKRLRPAMVLLSAGMCGYRGPSAIKMGAVVEIVHTATLIHDDIIDSAEVRRGRASANSRWGNHISVLAGDWMYMQSFQIALRERNFRILDLLINLTQLMVEGELMQLEQLGRIDVTEQEYSELVYRKTACLFSVCAQLGSVVASQPPEREKDLAEFGRNLGMAFQLVDDLLDFTSDEATLGKPVGNDLREGKVTLPAIHTLSLCTPKERGLIATVVTERGFRTVSQREIVELIERYEAPAAVKRRAGEYIARALDHLDSFPESPYKRALQAIPDFVLNREK
jgi:octaprenyl-diphosphate synthase